MAIMGPLWIVLIKNLPLIKELIDGCTCRNPDDRWTIEKVI